MDEQKEIPFRYAHGLLKVDCASKSWNDIQVRYFEKYPGPGKAYADMSSERSTLVVCLEDFVAKTRWPLLDRVRRADYRSRSLQMATLSG